MTKETIICPRCEGRGYIEPFWPVGPGGARLDDSPCSHCKGTGNISTHTAVATAQSPERALEEVTRPYTADNGYSKGVAADSTAQAPRSAALTSKVETLTEWREKELTYVVGALATALELEDDEQRDALCDIREWAKNRLTAKLPVETSDEFSYATKQDLFNAGATHAKYRVHYQKALAEIAKLKVTGPSPLGSLHGAGMATGFEIAAKIAEEAFDENPECSSEETSDNPYVVTEYQRGFDDGFKRATDGVRAVETTGSNARDVAKVREIFDRHNRVSSLLWGPGSMPGMILGPMDSDAAHHDRGTLLSMLTPEQRGDIRPVETCGKPFGDDVREFRCTEPAGHPPPCKQSPLKTDGWKCVTCGHENPPRVLRCQNPSCTAMSKPLKASGEPQPGDPCPVCVNGRIGQSGIFLRCGNCGWMRDPTLHTKGE